MTPDMGKMTLLRVMDAGCRGWEAPIIVDAACPANDVTTAMLSWANQPCPIPAQRSAQIKRHNTGGKAGVANEAGGGWQPIVMQL